MKVWRFYVKCDSIKNKAILPEEPENGYAIYAITNHKKRAERFMSDRNMNIFKVISSDIDKDDFVAYINEGNNQNYVLEYHPFDTRDVTNTGYYDTKSVQLLTTMFEYSNCSEEEFASLWIDVMQEEWWMGMPPIKYIDKEIKNPLKTLRYNKMCDLLTENFGAEVDDIASPDVHIDEVSIFIQVYRDVLAL